LLRTGWPLLILLLLPPGIGYLWHGCTFGHWGGSLVGLVIAVGFAAVFWHGVLARTTECNSSVYHRAEQPVRYWLTLGVWFAGYALGTASLLWAGSPS
jgi:hypothetical protein